MKINKAWLDKLIEKKDNLYDEFDEYLKENDLMSRDQPLFKKMNELIVHINKLK